MKHSTWFYEGKKVEIRALFRTICPAASPSNSIVGCFATGQIPFRVSGTLCYLQIFISRIIFWHLCIFQDLLLCNCSAFLLLKLSIMKHSTCLNTGKKDRDEIELLTLSGPPFAVLDWSKAGQTLSPRDGPWLDPTWAYFWPAVNKRPTRLWPGYFPTRPEAIFFDPKGKKLKNLMFLDEIFQILTQTINGWPDKKFWPGPITTVDTFFIWNQ